MEKVMTIYDWWDGPLYGLTTYRESICIYERIFDEATDDWSDEYYLTPIDEYTVNLLLKDWAVWCEAAQNGILNPSLHKENLYRNIIETSAHKRAYKRFARFHGCYGKGYIPINYSVEWYEKYGSSDT